ncbi:hypothetical protein CDAR_253061 [Caerostris darwini]|uniref:Uncharacterized protein n=1 Tax=Caerostris darwini TaxID=1538125 RepID=A0AAV4R753_9ARAC|nr:hypothetical protein CDAR_253061 [Caerostris darwini]
MFSPRVSKRKKIILNGSSQRLIIRRIYYRKQESTLFCIENGWQKRRAVDKENSRNSIRSACGNLAVKKYLMNRGSSLQIGLGLCRRESIAAQEWSGKFSLRVPIDQMGGGRKKKKKGD